MNKVIKTAFLGMFATLFSAMPVQGQSYDDCCYPSTCCYDECCDCCDRFWVDAEYLYWKIEDAPQHIPLVIEGPESQPILNDQDTVVVLGGKKIKNDWVSGARFGLGAWFDDCRTWGAEVNYFILPYQTKKHSVFNPGTEGSGFLAVPFFDVTTNSESSVDIAGFFEDGFGPYSGKATLKLRNRMQNAEANVIMAFPMCDCSCNMKVNLLAGFRWWNFDESLCFDTSSPFVNFPENIWVTRDKFECENNFYGAQIGVDLDYFCNCFFFNLKGKLALGANCAKSGIHGKFCTNDFAGPPFTAVPECFEGGYFALPTNIGKHTKREFAAIPEINANIGYQFSECFRVKVGYTFLWVSKVIRPGKQIDRRIDPTQSAAITGSPMINLASEDFPRSCPKTDSIWAQGINVGVDFSF